MNAPLAWLGEKREAAARQFRARGVPHRRVEAWKYTDLRSVVDADIIESAGALQWNVTGLPEGAELIDLEKAVTPPAWLSGHLGTLLKAGYLDAASLAFALSGWAVRIPPGAQAQLRIDFKSPGQGRALLLIEAGASVSLVETMACPSGFQNIGMEIVLAPDASLDHVRIMPESAGAVQIGSVSFALGRGARYRAHFANFGARMARTDLHLGLSEGSQAHLSGVSVLGGASHADVTTHIEHLEGETTSTQSFRLVAGGTSRAVYQGKITVAAGANGSDSRQTAKAILLGTRAEADLKPELEIFADDVKCAHGAAVGDLDAESLFYLRSRGVPEIEARNLLIRAFLEDALDGIDDPDIRAQVWDAVEEALPRAMEAAP